MKKHIKKKFLHEFMITEEIAQAVESSSLGVDPSKLGKMRNIPKDSIGFIRMDNNKVIQAFPYRYQGVLHMIPEPDPLLIYFNSAYYNFKVIIIKKKEILSILVKKELTEAIINDLYNYYGLVSGFVIFLFTAIEACMNKCIPRDFIYRKEGEKKTELYSKRQIEENIPFDEKIEKVLFQVKGKLFKKDHHLKYQHIENLKNFRDSIVHTKASKEGSSPYDYLYKRSLEFKYEDTINAVKDFINYYHVPHYIEECSCDNPD